VLALRDHWIWDFWLARDQQCYHAFFLKAPKSLGDPDARHWSARIGHAVSQDLRSWEVLPDALGVGEPGAWDDKATWTGSVVAHDGRWYLFYTGISTAEDGLVQRIGVATSDDLLTWHKPLDHPVLTTDPRWYEQLDTAVWHEEACRDPWVFVDPSGGGFRMLFTARVHSGPPDGRGVIGQARSDDLQTWEVLPPLTQPGDFGHLEVPQLAPIGDWWYLVFSVYEWAHSAARVRRASAVCGTHYMMARSPLGPFLPAGDEFLSGTPAGPFYAGKLVEGPRGEWLFMTWAQFGTGGRFIGALADPVPVIQEPDGRLRLSTQPSLDAVLADYTQPPVPARSDP